MAYAFETANLSSEVRHAYDRKDWATARERRRDLTDFAVPCDPGPVSRSAQREYQHLGGDLFTDVHALHELTEAAMLALRATMRGERIDDTAMWILEANTHVEESEPLGAARALLANDVLQSLAHLAPATSASIICFRKEAV
jgi:hypothetical protein